MDATGFLTQPTQDLPEDIQRRIYSLYRRARARYRAPLLWRALRNYVRRFSINFYWWYYVFLYEKRRGITGKPTWGPGGFFRFPRTIQYRNNIFHADNAAAMPLREFLGF